jgi:hypothetical protein
MYISLFWCVTEWFRPQYSKPSHLRFVATNGMTTTMLVNLIAILTLSRHFGLESFYLSYSRKGPLTLGCFVGITALIWVAHYLWYPRVKQAGELDQIKRPRKPKMLALVYVLSSYAFLAAVMLERWT